MDLNNEVRGFTEMNIQPEINESTAFLDLRRNPRVPVNLSLRLETQSSDGTPLYVRVKAINVSCKGATLISDSVLDIDKTVRILSPFGNLLEAQVNKVWVDEGDGKQRLSVKLLHPDGWFPG